jgi:KDO2-lipid IV(A) lauroyltransferase
MLNKKKIVDAVKNYMLSDNGIKHMPYALGSRLIWWFCGTKYAQTEYFRKKVTTFNTFLLEIKKPEADKRMLQEILNFSFIKKWRVPSFSNLSDKQLNKNLKIQDLHYLKDSYDKGKGVVLISSHYGFAELALPAFPRLGYDLHTIVASRGAESEKFTALNPDIDAKTITFDHVDDIGQLKAMMRAKDILDKGGVVHLLSDGYQGKSTTTLPFISKVRGFRGSYAELGLSTEAAIVPVFIYPVKAGKVMMKLYPPLDKGSEDEEREKRVQHIIKQYVDILALNWVSNPQYVNLGHQAKYLHHVGDE